MIPENDQIAQSIDENLNSAPHGRDRANMIRLIVEALNAKDKERSDEVRGMYEYTDELKAQLSRLQKLYEEQAREIESLKREKNDRRMSLAQEIYCLLKDNGHWVPSPDKIDSSDLINSVGMLILKVSQLATQTERVRVLEEALRPFANPDYIGIAIGDHERAKLALHPTHSTKGGEK